MRSKKQYSREAKISYPVRMGNRAHRVDSIDLAYYLLAECGGMPHLKLQKLVYYAQAWHLALFNEPLVDDEFQAWVHGPVSTKIWHKFKTPGSPVLGQIKLDGPTSVRVKTKFPAEITPEQRDLIRDVIKEYGDKSAYHLECLTHAEKPWIDARGTLAPGEKSTNILPKESIAKFYHSRLKS